VRAKSQYCLLAEGRPQVGTTPSIFALEVNESPPVIYEPPSGLTDEFSSAPCATITIPCSAILVHGTAMAATGQVGFPAANGTAVTVDITQGAAAKRNSELLSLNARRVSRPLTQGERTLADTIFRGQINYDKSGVIDGRYLPFFRTATPSGIIYAAPGEYRTNYSLLSSNEFWLKSTFVHEMTHVWQHQVGMNVKSRRFFLGWPLGHEGTYNYVVGWPTLGSKPFTWYGIEQQAQIVEDFYRLGQNYPMVYYDYVVAHGLTPPPIASYTLVLSIFPAVLTP
jgi:hypothetical protein